MAEDEADYMVCVRVDELETPVEGSTKTACVDCGSDIWISMESRKEMYRLGAMPLCMRCSKRMAAESPDEVEMGMPSMGQLSEIGKTPGDFHELVRDLKRAAMQYEAGGDIPEWADDPELDNFEAMKKTAQWAQSKMTDPQEDWGSMVIMENFNGITYPPVPLGKMLSSGVPKEVIAKQLIPGLAHTGQAKRVLFGMSTWMLDGEQAEDHLKQAGSFATHPDRKERLVLIDVTADGVQQMSYAEIMRDGVSPPTIGEWHDTEKPEASNGLFVDALVPALQLIRTMRGEGDSV